MTRTEIENWKGYLKNCSDAQVIGCYEKERVAGRDQWADYAAMEAERRGLQAPQE